MKFAYADPPYIGQAKRHYGEHVERAIEETVTGWDAAFPSRGGPERLTLIEHNVRALAQAVEQEARRDERRKTLEGAAKAVRDHENASPRQFTTDHERALTCEEVVRALLDTPSQPGEEPKRPAHVCGQCPEFCPACAMGLEG